MRTILDKILLCYANTLEIKYLGRRVAEIKFLGHSRKRDLERKLKRVYEWDRDYKFDWIDDFNCNGKGVWAIIKLTSDSKPFYRDTDELWIRPELDYKRIITSNHAGCKVVEKGGVFTIVKETKGKNILSRNKIEEFASGVNEQEAWRNTHIQLFPNYWKEVIQPPIKN